MNEHACGPLVTIHSTDFRNVVELLGKLVEDEKPKYNPVAKAYDLLTKAFNSPDPSYGDLLIVIEEAIGYLGEALE